MGLTDFYAADDDFAFPDFDASFSPSNKAPESGDNSASTSSNSSQDKVEAKSPNSPAASSTSTGPKPARPTKFNRRHSTFSKPPKPSPGKCFDLYGEDDDLQSAEPKIRFCDICFKHCDIH